jgi:hypothetical protein
MHGRISDLLQALVALLAGLFEAPQPIPVRATIRCRATIRHASTRLGRR